MNRSALDGSHLAAQPAGDKVGTEDRLRSTQYLRNHINDRPRHRSIPNNTKRPGSIQKQRHPDGNRERQKPTNDIMPAKQVYERIDERSVGEKADRPDYEKSKQRRGVNLARERA
jgi:hypothetical protein